MAAWIFFAFSRKNILDVFCARDREVGGALRCAAALDTLNFVLCQTFLGSKALSTLITLMIPNLKVHASSVLFEPVLSTAILNPTEILATILTHKIDAVSFQVHFQDPYELKGSATLIANMILGLLHLHLIFFVNMDADSMLSQVTITCKC